MPVAIHDIGPHDPRDGRCDAGLIACADATHDRQIDQLAGDDQQGQTEERADDDQPGPRLLQRLAHS